MKIFISSTYEDLKDHRHAVHEAIRRLGHQPIGMEDFGSQPNEPKVAALGKISGCDAFVGVYAHCYGTIPDDDALSITEQEFDNARARDIPCLCYRLDLNFDWPEQFKDTGKKAEKLAAFLRKIDNKLLRSLFTTPDDLAKQVGIDIGREFPKDFALTAISALHSLPSTPADFTGRAHELDQLLKDIGGGGPLISGLSGMGGVGKTALALVVAHRLAEHYPDAQISLDMKGTSTTRISPTDAMKHVIHRFEPQADLRQASDDEIAAMYRSLLNGKRALLLFDNAADAAQVRPLIPPPTCALLVTSRKYFTLPGLQPLRLDMMSENDARDLLLNLCARISGHADEIAKLCGYLPLALRIAGSALTERMDISPIDYIARLKQQPLALLKLENDPDANVERAFALSYDLLSPDIQARWRELSVFPAPFHWNATADLWELAEEETKVALSDLVRFSLLDYDEESKRYRLHDLLAAFASARLVADERSTAQLRHAQYYVKIAREADQLYLQGKTLEGLALFNVEWENIKAGQAWAAGNFSAYELAARLCNDYPAVSAHNLVLQVAPNERIEWLESAIKAAGILGDRHGELNHLGNLGIAYADLGETGKAIEFFEQALAISRAASDRHSEGNQLCNLGNAYHDLGDMRKAIEFQDQALAIARAIGDRRGEGRRLGNLGLAYAALGDTRKAIQFYEPALAIAREIGDRHDEGNALGNIGDAYDLRGEKQKAIKFYEQALAIARVIGDRDVQGNQLGNLGLAYASLGETRKAIEFMEQALRIFDVLKPQYAKSVLGHLVKLKRQLSSKPSP